MQPTKLALELGPVTVFFGAIVLFDIYVATGAFMTATVVSLIASKILLKKLPTMLLFTSVIVLVFGSLTLFFHDDVFIKIKPTITYVLFAATLGIGLALGRPLLKIVLGQVIQLQDEGWRKLSLRWAIFFLFLAILNEIVWRNFSDEVWAGFKLFGFTSLTLLFMATQIRLLQKYQMPEGVVDAQSH